MGSARRPPSGGQRPRRTLQLPATYSHEYPVSQGHDYRLRGVPKTTWKRALERSHAEGRAIRVVLIRALEQYAAGRLQL